MNRDRDDNLLRSLGKQFLPQATPITADLSAADVAVKGRAPSMHTKSGNRRLTRLGLAAAVSVLVIGGSAGAYVIFKRPKSTKTPVLAVNDAKPLPTKNYKKPERPYYAPVANDAWTYTEDSAVFDEPVDVINLMVTIKAYSANVQLSQQPTPANFKPFNRSDALNEFVTALKAEKSVLVNKKRLYIVPSLEDQDKSATVVWVTDDFLVFGRTDKILPNTVWVNLYSALTIVQPK